MTRREGVPVPSLLNVLPLFLSTPTITRCLPLSSPLFVMGQVIFASVRPTCTLPQSAILTPVTFLRRHQQTPCYLSVNGNSQPRQFESLLTETADVPRQILDRETDVEGLSRGKVERLFVLGGYRNTWLIYFSDYQNKV